MLHCEYLYVRGCRSPTPGCVFKRFDLCSINKLPCRAVRLCVRATALNNQEVVG